MRVEGRSANHFELAFTESDILLDFGQSYGETAEALMLARIILTPQSAKTFLVMLRDLLDQYEKSVGPIPGKKV